MSHKLIWNPSVAVIAKTDFCLEGFVDWLNLNDIDPNSDVYKNSPINNLWENVNDDYAGERLIEFAGRHCYQSWQKGRESYEYIRNIIDSNHGSVLEHAHVSFAIQGVSRSLTHELVRHRVGCSPSQQSQRYVDAKDINFVVPPLLIEVTGGGTNDPLITRFYDSCEKSVREYSNLQAELNAAMPAAVKKRVNEAARSLLPNACETRLVWTANYRLLRHFFFLRGGVGADLEIRRLAVYLLEIMQGIAPTVFQDFYFDDSNLDEDIVSVIKCHAN